MGGDFKMFFGEFYYKRKLKWYEKIYYFLTGKKNEYQKLGNISEILGKEDKQ